MFSLCRFAALFYALAVAPAAAHATLIDFWRYTSGTQITTHYAGVVFSGATIYMPGAGAVAAHSGSSEILDASNSSISMSFPNGQTQFSAGSSAQTAFAASGSGMTRIAITPVSDTFTPEDLSYTPPAVNGSQASGSGSLLLLGTGLVGFACVSGLRAAHRRSALAMGAPA